MRYSGTQSTSSLSCHSCSPRVCPAPISRHRRASLSQVARPALFRLSVGRDIEPVICWLRWAGALVWPGCWSGCPASWKESRANAGAGTEARGALLNCMHRRLAHPARACPSTLPPAATCWVQEHRHQRAATGGAGAAHARHPQVGRWRAPREVGGRVRNGMGQGGGNQLPYLPRAQQFTSTV